MLAEQRFELILQALREKRAVGVPELCILTGASEATIRRDLGALDSQGRLSKVHGGAVLADNEFQGEEPDLDTKSRLFQSEKDAIARYAAALIRDDDVVYLDAGTTTGRMAEYLKESKAAFVTNGISCAQRLLENGCKSYILGGCLKPGTGAVVGAGAVESLSRYNFTKAFLGINGISVQQGFTTPDPEEAAVKAEAFHRSRQTYVLADASKFGRVAAVTVLPLEDAPVITNKDPGPAYAEHTTIREVEPA